MKPYAIRLYWGLLCLLFLPSFLPSPFPPPDQSIAAAIILSAIHHGLSQTIEQVVNGLSWPADAHQ
jgi:hypothetical protein